MISISGLVYAVLAVLVVGAIFGLLFWATRRIPMPEPFKMVADVILVLAAVIILILILLSLLGSLGGQPIFRP